MNQTEPLLADLDYLQRAGLTVTQLRSLHHWSDRPEAASRVTFESALQYFSKGRDMKANNAAFAERLRFIVETHKRGLSAVVDGALQKYPVNQPADK